MSDSTWDDALNEHMFANQAVKFGFVGSIESFHMLSDAQKFAVLNLTRARCKADYDARMKALEPAEEQWHEDIGNL